MRFHSNGETRFLFWKMIFEKLLESPLIFVLFFKGKNKIRKKKTLNVTPEGKTGLWKIESESGDRVTY